MGSAPYSAPSASGFVRNAFRFLIPSAQVIFALPANEISDVIVPTAGPQDTGVPAKQTAQMIAWSLRRALLQVASGSRNLVSLQSARADLLVGGEIVDSCPIITSGITALAHGQMLSSAPRQVQYSDFGMIIGGVVAGQSDDWQLQLTIEANSTSSGAVNLTVENVLWQIDRFELTAPNLPTLSDG